MNTANPIAEKLQQCYACIREKTDFVPVIALTLGSGLGDFADTIQIEAVVDYHDIDGFPVSTIEGHKGRFIFGYVQGVPVVCMQGRIHYYEGYAMSDVVLPIRVMGLLGAKLMFLTNAAGGINSSFQAGDLMLIQDQISSFVPSPLIGPNINIEDIGAQGACERFPDMSEIYDRELTDIVHMAASNLGIPMQEGVYLQMQGPNYESPAEIFMCRTIGADAVGMSTACEAIAAKHMGMKVVGISFISNMAAGISPEPLSHEEVQQRAEAVGPKFQKIVARSIEIIGACL